MLLLLPGFSALFRVIDVFVFFKKIYKECLSEQQINPLEFKKKVFRTEKRFFLITILKNL